MSSAAEYGNLAFTDLLDCPDNQSRTVAEVQQLGHEAATSLFPKRRRGLDRVRPARLVIIGPSRSGKDEVAHRLSEHWGRRFSGSSSWVIMPYVAHVMRSSVEAMYNLRHSYRAFMYHFCKGARRDDPTFLVRLTLQDSSISVGLRDKVEIDASKASQLLPLVVWVDRPVPPDPTLELTVDDADIVLRNHGTLDELQVRVARLAAALERL